MELMVVTGTVVLPMPTTVWPVEFCWMLVTTPATCGVAGTLPDAASWAEIDRV